MGWGTVGPLPRRALLGEGLPALAQAGQGEVVGEFAAGPPRPVVAVDGPHGVADDPGVIPGRFPRSNLVAGVVEAAYELGFVDAGRCHPADHDGHFWAGVQRGCPATGWGASGLAWARSNSTRPGHRVGVSP